MRSYLQKFLSKGADDYAWEELNGYLTDVNHSVAYKFSSEGEKNDRELSELAR